MTAVGLTILLCAIVGLISCSALFSGLETALFTLKSYQIQRLQERHPSLANFLHTFRDNPRRVLSVLLLGDTMVNVPLIILCLVLIWEGPLVTHLPAWIATLADLAMRNLDGWLAPPPDRDARALTLARAKARGASG